MQINSYGSATYESYFKKAMCLEIVMYIFQHCLNISNFEGPY